MNESSNGSSLFTLLFSSTISNNVIKLEEVSCFSTLSLGVARLICAKISLLVPRATEVIELTQHRVPPGIEVEGPSADRTKKKGGAHSQSAIWYTVHSGLASSGILWLPSSSLPPAISSLLTSLPQLDPT